MNRPTNLETRSHPKGCSRKNGLTWFVRPGDGTLPSGAMVVSPETLVPYLCPCRLPVMSQPA